MITIDSYKYKPSDIANWFLCHIDREAGDAITHLKLQKLLYYSQAWCIVLSGKSLFEEDFEAWSHGPVLPDIYHQYKHFGYDALPSCDCANSLASEAENVLQQVQRLYGEKSAKYLEELTHQESPWIEARAGLPLELRCSNVISKESMAGFYSKMLQTNEG
ncbi:DUF4065 domain-containing protein [Dyadobacter sp. CY261]|uniref:Panacea domain-containing protein n=1 Tax=Dyadobacter sp. CY261 TaxID=2907203 RepID=UPI001F1AEFED|nr:type II toxin-antitoxin system antitoxin SocA domain-containing protein [Dyadobacter sp. CY261]MCF0072106.1 DUF4065 domain-containing protein [Dyadobacter sp. CY261]